MISIIDYGAGNLASIQNLVDSLAYDAQTVSYAKDMPKNTSTIILPGVGDGSYMMQQLHERAFTSLLKHWLAEDRPLFGVCVGAQVLLSLTEEGNTPCLDYISGACKSFETRIRQNENGHALDSKTSQYVDKDGIAKQLKIPHMGWNQVRQNNDALSSKHSSTNLSVINGTPNRIFSNIPDGSYFYFVHSYYLSAEDRNYALATTHYGIEFDAIVGKGQTIGTQFHPEKSGKWGRILFDNFLQYYGKEVRATNKEQI